MAPTSAWLWAYLSVKSQETHIATLDRLPPDKLSAFESYLDALSGDKFEELLSLLGAASSTQFEVYIAILIGQFDWNLGAAEVEPVDILEASLGKLAISTDNSSRSLDIVNDQLDNLVAQVGRMQVTDLKQAKNDAFLRRGLRIPVRSLATDGLCESDQAILDNLEKDFQWVIPSGEANKFLSHVRQQPILKSIYLSFSIRDLPTAWHLADLAILTLHLEDRTEPVTRLDVLQRFRQQCSDFIREILNLWCRKFKEIASLQLEELQLDFSEALAPDGTFLGEQLAHMLVSFTFAQPKYFAIIALTEASESRIRGAFARREQAKGC